MSTLVLARANIDPDLMRCLKESMRARPGANPNAKKLAQAIIDSQAFASTAVQRQPSRLDDRYRSGGMR